MLESEKRAYEKQKAFHLASQDLSSFIQKGRGIELSPEAFYDMKEILNGVLAYYKMDSVSVPHDITEDSQIINYVLNATGLAAREIELTQKWWRQYSGPLIVQVKENGYTFLEKSSHGSYQYFDLDCNRMRKVTKQNSGKFTGNAYYFYKPLPQKSLTISDLSGFILSSLSPSDMMVALLGIVLSTLMGLALPAVNKYVYDMIIPSGNYQDILPVIILLSGIALSTSMISMAKNLSMERLIHKVTLDFESATFLRLLNLPYTFFKEYSAGQLSCYISNVEILCQGLCNTVLTIMLTLVFSAAYLIQIYFFVPMLFAPTLSIIFAMLLLLMLIGSLQYKAQKVNLRLAAELFGLVNQLFRGIEKIKNLGGEVFAFARWSKVYHEKIKLKQYIFSMDEAVFSLLGSCGALIIYYKAGSYSVNPSSFIGFSIAYTAVITFIIKLMDAARQISMVIPIANMVVPIYTAVPEGSSGKRQIKELKGNISVSNVSFSYEDSDKLILDNVSFEIKSGDYIGIVGETGCGKSTLLKLLLGLEKANNGAIYYDDQDIHDIDIRTLRQKIGTVTQNSRLVNGSILENITVGSTQLTLDDVWQAVTIAGVEEDIKRMPMGLFTVIPESGGGISGGQAQRIAIARAIVNKPKILYFDEATSALDNGVQKSIISEIDKLDCTKIVIAHRLITVKNCSRIMVLSGGKIVQQGTYHELMNVEGLFRTLAMRQIR